MEKMFRKLRADEIDVRVASINKKGCSLLLYKDSRVDQNILDETVGPMNWQRQHSRDNANCEVGIWDKDKELWVWKEDTGTESYTEKEKGLASDSFKRACFNWGIGRELYTAPFIWISASDVNLEEKDGKYKTYDHFTVRTIEYSDDKISRLEIVNDKMKRVVWTMGILKASGDKETPAVTAKAPTEADKKKPATLDQITEIKRLCKKEAVADAFVAKSWSVDGLDKLNYSQAYLTITQFDRFKSKYEESTPFK